MILLLDRLQHLGRVEVRQHVEGAALITVGAKKAAPACDSGVHIRKRGDSGHSHSASCTCVIVDIACAVPMMPLGLPVVPPV